jgi:probable HAF family extracellular repeat protein
MTDLGGGDFSKADAINDKGQIVGLSTVGTEDHASLWQDGKMTDLGLIGGNQSEALAINRSGEIAGWSNTTGGASPIFHAVLWTRK